jgi:hypothetical protein
MGAAAVSVAEVPHLTIEFADGLGRRRLGAAAEITVIFFDVGDPEALPDYKESTGPLFAPMHSVNHDYFRKLARYTRTYHVCKPSQFAVVSDLKGNQPSGRVKEERATP